MPAYDDARSEGNGESVQCTRSRGMQWAASRMRIAHHSAVLKRQRLAMATQHRRAVRARRPLHLRTNVARYRGQTAVNCGRVGRHRGDANHAGAVLPGLCLATVGVRPPQSTGTHARVWWASPHTGAGILPILPAAATEHLAALPVRSGMQEEQDCGWAGVWT
jgi:hypothetical protein